MQWQSFMPRLAEFIFADFVFALHFQPLRNRVPVAFAHGESRFNDRIHGIRFLRNRRQFQSVIGAASRQSHFLDDFRFSADGFAPLGKSVSRKRALQVQMIRLKDGFNFSDQRRRSLLIHAEKPPALTIRYAVPELVFPQPLPNLPRLLVNGRLCVSLESADRRPVRRPVLFARPQTALRAEAVLRPTLRANVRKRATRRRPRPQGSIQRLRPLTSA